jgi:hypothetical protein
MFGSEAPSDFVEPFIKRVEPGVKASIVEVKYIAKGCEAENPVVAFDVDEDLLDGVADKRQDTQQNVHRIPRSEKMSFRSWKNLILEGSNSGTKVSMIGVLGPAPELFVMLAQIGVKRLRAGLRKQRLEHHVAATALREMRAVGLSQCLDAGVAVFLVDAAGRITMSAVQTFFCFLAHLLPSEMLI